MAPLTMTIEAKGILDGDWVEGEGIVKEVCPAPTVVVAFFARRHCCIYDPNERVVVRIEDHGEKR